MNAHRDANSDEYDAGHQAGHEAGKIVGLIEARLTGHDKHFATINGSIRDTAVELAALKLALERLTTQTVKTDANARLTEAARATTEHDHLTDVAPWVKAVLALVVVALLVLGLLLYLQLR
jgi:uncharacterized membrane protein YidH (DUF202 family)